MKNSDYFVPQTQCNDKGVPQGAYLDMDAFIRDQSSKLVKVVTKRLPAVIRLTPRRLYFIHLPRHRLFVQESLHVGFNIICSEQDLAQQKVALGMCMMNPAMKGRQYHLSYDLVKLTTGKMSGRRGRATY